MSRFPRDVTRRRKSVYFSVDHSRGGQTCVTAIEEQLLFSDYCSCELLAYTLLFQFH